MTKDYIYIFGPCGIDDRDTYINTGKYLYELLQNKNFYYKASYLKQNRTSLYGERCVGLTEGIKCFKEIKELIPGIKITTDVHSAQEVEILAPYVDLIQIPSMLSRQTDIIVECATHFNNINIKKMQFLFF